MWFNNIINFGATAKYNVRTYSSAAPKRLVYIPCSETSNHNQNNFSKTPTYLVACCCTRHLMWYIVLCEKVKINRTI